MRINADSFVGVGICILGLVGVGYAIGVHSKMKVMCDRLDTSIDNLANNTEIDIPAKVIDQAVQKAVERESYSAVKRATEEVVADAKREIESRVGTAVKAQYDAISDGEGGSNRQECRPDRREQAQEGGRAEGQGADRREIRRQAGRPAGGVQRKSPERGENL